MKFKLSKFKIIIWFLFVFISFITTIFLLVDPFKPDYYNFLFLLPLTFGLLSAIFGKIYEEIINNLAITILLILLFVRMVISPAFMFLGEYAGTINYNAQYNTFPAIVLLIYETICIFIFLFFKINNIRISDKKYYAEEYITHPKISRKYSCIIMLSLLLLIVCIYLAPGIIEAYRPITSIGDKNFTNQEDAYIVAKYATSFVSKLALVTGNYLFRILLILIPAVFIIRLAYKPNIFRKYLGIACCLIPLLFISGSIARSLIYSVCLFLLYNYMFNDDKIYKKSAFIIFLGCLAALSWWLFRTGDENLLILFSRRFSSYFSGVNVVSGAFNLPNDFILKIKYFFNDFLRSIPYGTTIFRLNFDTVQTFFNEYNYSTGQIPTTIGMGYYYFGPIFAPIYSLIFANVACNVGTFLKRKQFGNPIRCLRLLLMAFYYSMGIVMYNIDIVFTATCCLIFPLYLMECIGYKKEVKNK